MGRSKRSIDDQSIMRGIQCARYATNAPIGLQCPKTKNKIKSKSTKNINNPIYQKIQKIVNLNWETLLRIFHTNTQSQYSRLKVLSSSDRQTATITNVTQYTDWVLPWIQKSIKDLHAAMKCQEIQSSPLVIVQSFFPYDQLDEKTIHTVRRSLYA